jgi:hypothetical protein
MSGEAKNDEAIHLLPIRLHGVPFNEPSPGTTFRPSSGNVEKEQSS